MLESAKLWPTVRWLEITSQYAGLFFRAEGGNAVAFNKGEQNDTSPRITRLIKVYNSSKEWNMGLTYNQTEYEHPEFGVGGSDGKPASLKIHTCYNEVRPRNKSIRIWERSA